MTTPVIPGSRISSGWTTMSQIEVPITITNVPGSSTPDARHRHERVDVADRDRDRLRQPDLAPPPSRAASPPAFPAARTSSPSFSPGVSKPGIGRLEVLGRRQALVRRPHRLVAGGAALPALDAGQPPDDPVGRLDEAVALVVDLAVLEPHLDQLREVPLRGDAPAVAREERARRARARPRSAGRRPAAPRGASTASATRAGASRQCSSVHSGTPSASPGSTVQDVKSIPSPTTSLGVDARLRDHVGTASSITLTQSSGSCSAQSGGSRSPVAGSSRSITPLG